MFNMTNVSLPYTYQPQPPPHPKTMGGKRGLSAPIPIPSSSSTDEENDYSITDLSPPIASRVLPLDSSFSSKPFVLPPTPLPSPQSHGNGNAKKHGLVHSPRASTNNNNNNANIITAGTAAAISSSTTLNNNSNNRNVGISSNSSSSNSSNNLLGSNVLHSHITTNNNSSNNSSNNGHACISNSGNNGQMNGSSPSTNFTSNSSNASSLPPALSPSSSPCSPSSSSSSTSSSSPSSHTGVGNMRTLPPSITIPSNTISLNNNNHNNNTSIPAIFNLALSPTAQSQSATNNINNTNSSSNGYSSNSVSQDSYKENSSPPSSPRGRSCSPSSGFAYDHDHDYDSVASPCSSTASGPTYVRPAGFQHHAQEIVATKSKLKKKKSSATLTNLREGFKKREPTPPRLKPKREPLPMKLRALPQSFWQQPNVAQNVSPASMFPILPPLCNKDMEEAMDERPVTPPGERELERKLPERKITVANTDLLLKLFDGVGEEKKGVHTKSKQSLRHRKPMPKNNTKGLFLGKDPFMMDAVTEKIFPQLTLEGTKYPSGGGNAYLHLITLKEGDRDVMLPSLSMEQNYPQMLSELVMHLS